jgi:hypothetical protein
MARLNLAILYCAWVTTIIFILINCDVPKKKHKIAIITISERVDDRLLEVKKKAERLTGIPLK